MYAIEWNIFKSFLEMSPTDLLVKNSARVLSGSDEPDTDDTDETPTPAPTTSATNLVVSLFAALMMLLL